VKILVAPHCLFAFCHKTGFVDRLSPQSVNIIKTKIPFVYILESVVYEKVCKALKNKRLKKGIQKASPLSQTSCVEGFHSVLNQFAPKMIAYSYPGMYIR
jgi:hypothetical protein